MPRYSDFCVDCSDFRCIRTIMCLRKCCSACSYWSVMSLNTHHALLTFLKSRLPINVGWSCSWLRIQPPPLPRMSWLQLLVRKNFSDWLTSQLFTSAEIEYMSTVSKSKHRFCLRMCSAVLILVCISFTRSERVNWISLYTSVSSPSYQCTYTWLMMFFMMALLSRQKKCSSLMGLGLLLRSQWSHISMMQLLMSVNLLISTQSRQCCKIISWLS